MREQGKIRLIGLSNVTQEHIERARRIVPIASVQNRYSFADQEWDYVLDYCARNGIVFIPWAPLGFGMANDPVVSRIAKAHQASPRQVVDCVGLAALAEDPADTGNLVAAHVEENIAAAGLRLSDQEFKEL